MLEPNAESDCECLGFDPRAISSVVIPGMDTGPAAENEYSLLGAS